MANALPFTVDAPLPSRALHALATDLAQQLQYAFLAAAAGTPPTTRGRVDNLCEEFTRTRPSQSRQRYHAIASKLLQQPADVLEREAGLGRYSAVPIQMYMQNGFNKLEALAGGRIKQDSQALQDTLDRVTKSKTQHLDDTGLKAIRQAIEQQQKHGQDVLEGKQFTKLQLLVKRVRCIADSTELGSDQINLGGAAVDPNGATHGVSQFEVSDDFDDGETVDFGGVPRVFAEWSLVDGTADGSWPKYYGAMIAMAEKDPDGGFYKFLKGVWDELGEKATAAIAAAIGGAIGSAGGVIGAIVGAAVGLFIGWLISLFKGNDDDIFPVHTLDLWLGSATKSYYDWAKLTQVPPDVFPLEFKTDDSADGHYRVALFYRVAA